jgi:hypothetical protein
MLPWQYLKILLSLHNCFANMVGIKERLQVLKVQPAAVDAKHVRYNVQQHRKHTSALLLLLSAAAAAAAVCCCSLLPEGIYHTLRPLQLLYLGMAALHYCAPPI